MAGGLDEIREIHRWFSDEVTLLVNEKVDLEDKMSGIEIIGLDDTTSSKMLAAQYNGVDKDNSKFKILLEHQPYPLTNVVPADTMPDLYLSGHTHGGGQFLIFTPFVKLAFPFMGGEYRNTVDGCTAVVYTSPGTGVWGPPIRHYGRSLVTVIDLVPTN